MRKARRFHCQAESVASARHFVRDVLGDQPREIVEAAELMVSELATNSVRHAHSDFELAILLSQREIRVEVSDHGQGQPVPRSPTPREQSGRGLQIVIELSDAWGISPSPDGKLVWFTLPLRTRPGEDRPLDRSREKAPEQSHEPERGHKADLGSSLSRIVQLRWVSADLESLPGRGRRTRCGYLRIACRPETWPCKGGNGRGAVRAAAAVPFG
jgi:anti-sigma regulatory factor (Ser/Thr protein kinase)